MTISVKRLPSICGAVLIMVAGVPAAEWPVSNPAELTTALGRSQPGDIILMADGTWKDVEIVFDAKGLADKPVTLRARTPGKVILTGRSTLRLAGEYLVVDGLWFKDGFIRDESIIGFRGDSRTLAVNCRLTNCAITDFNPPERKKDYKWCSLYGRSNRVDHCYFAGKNHAGTTLVVWVDGQPNFHRIDHNHFGPRPPLGANGGETVRVGTSDVSMNVSRTLVEENLFERCNGEIEIVSNKSCENVYRNNTFLECAGALTLRHGNRCEVYGNVFIGNGQKNTGGVRVIGEDHRVFSNRFFDLAGQETRAAICLMNGIVNSPLNGYFQVKRALITSNIFARCRQDFVVGYPGEKATLPPVECVITNNVIVTSQENSKAPSVSMEGVGPLWRVTAVQNGQ